ncbi:MAG: LytTR family DNA-binding domain-containing protein [Saprospiraceae bacterium]|nr:response regulator transcription factor [Lewinella sp.]
MKIRTLIIDDEALARRRIRHLLDQRENVEVLKECKSGEEAINAIEREKPDLIFLDIQMKDMTGFEVLESVSVHPLPMTIFVTAYDQYAIKAFDIFAFDYLLKPFKEERFELSVDKAIASLRKNNSPDFGNSQQIQSLLSYLHQHTSGETANSSPAFANTIPIKGAGKISFVEPKDIVHIEASGYYIEIHTEDKKYLLRESLGNMAEKLDEQIFIRIHRSTIVNLHYMEEIQHNGSSEVEVVLKNGRSFRVSKSYREELFERLGI